MSPKMPQIVRTSTVVNTGPVAAYPAHAAESEAQALHRLARQAHDKGVKLIVNRVTNHHFCTSATNRDKLHAVTLYSCDCRGFLAHGLCMHLALVLEAYHSLPAIDPEPDPDGGGVGLPTSAATAAKVATDVTPFVPSDVVVSIVPARRPVVEGVRVAYAGNRPSGSTYRILHADAVVVDGVRHQVGDRVLITDRRMGWIAARITCIRTVGSTGRVWKVDVDGTGYGETTRSLAEVRAIAAVGSEAVRHAA